MTIRNQRGFWRQVTYVLVVILKHVRVAALLSLWRIKQAISEILENLLGGLTVTEGACNASHKLSGFLNDFVHGVLPEDDIPRGTQNVRMDTFEIEVHPELSP